MTSFHREYRQDYQDEDVERALQVLHAVLRKAFNRFVELVQPIPQVRHMVAFDDGSPDVCTFIEKRDVAVCMSIFEAEYRFIDEFPKINN